MAGQDIKAANVIELFKSKEHFSNEKALCDYIEINIQDFCKELGYNYKSHNREWSLTYMNRFGPRPPRVDFKIELEDNQILLVECKCPSQTYSEVNKGISQILSYYLKAKDYKLNLKECWLVSTEIDLDSVRIIEEFKLPVNICVIKKGSMAIWKSN